jgi:hypothetical protein
MPKVVEMESFDLPRPGDHYLKLVIGKFGNEFGTWLKNTSIGGYHYGHYFTSEESARDDLKERKDYYGIKN